MPTQERVYTIAEYHALLASMGRLQTAALQAAVPTLLTRPTPLAWPAQPLDGPPVQATRPCALPLTISFPGLRLRSESNVASHEHWRKRQQRAKDQRATVYYGLRGTSWTIPALPLVVTLTRVAPRPLDDDNLVSACKAVRDAVADWLAGGEGMGEDRQPGLTFLYAQRRGVPHEYALELTLEGSPHD